MKNLKKLAKENAQKGSWVRKAVEKFMDAWRDATDDCELLMSEAPVYIRDMDHMIERFYLTTSTIELKAIDDGGGMYDVSDSQIFWHALPISDTRAVFEKIPAAIESIEKQLEKANTDSDLLVGKLTRLINMLNPDE